jgi:ATP-binding cassette, subfamily B, bacterial PglK
VRELSHQVRRVIDRRFAWGYAAIAAASVLVAALDAVGILLLIPLIDVLSEAGDGADPASLPLLGDVPVGALLVGVVAFFIAKSLGMAAIRWWSSGIVARASSTVAARLFAGYMAAPIEFHDRRNTAESVRTITKSVQELFGKGGMAAAAVVAEGATLAVLSMLVLIAAPVPALAGLAYFGAASIAYLRVLQPRTKRRSQQAQALTAEAVKAVQEGLGGLREHRVRGSEPGLVGAFATRQLRLAAANRFTSFASELSRYYLEVLFIGGFGIITGVVLVTASGSAALTALAVLLAVGFRVLPSISRLLAGFTNLRVGRTALELVISDLDAMGIDRLRSVPAAAGFGELGVVRRPPAKLEVQHVSFQYRQAVEPALRDVTLQLEPGTSLGIVGPSGAGKSTLIDLICGIRPCDAGQILIDGHTLRHASQRWRQSIGLVPQSVFLLDASVRANVAFGLPESDDRVWEALERARLASFVRGLPSALDTMIGERGTRLSGGQRQRLGIARALYGRPAVLVLDEATAALDVETEAEVVQAISELAGEQSLLVVAHRLSTIRRCDRVAYLDRGRVACVGTFHEVVERVPDFARAVRLANLA